MGTNSNQKINPQAMTQISPTGFILEPSPLAVFSCKPAVPCQLFPRQHCCQPGSPLPLLGQEFFPLQLPGPDCLLWLRPWLIFLPGPAPFWSGGSTGLAAGALYLGSLPGLHGSPSVAVLCLSCRAPGCSLAVEQLAQQ